jgi:hypothetical protein
MQQAQTIMALEDARATNQNIYMLAVDFSSAFNARPGQAPADHV